MFTAEKYCFAHTVQEAQALLDARPNNAVLGGCCWMKMSSSSYKKVIDLSLLGLDTITEDDQGFCIGAMVTLHQLETHPGIHRYFDGAFKKMLSEIVGVQFRNCATVGGSVFSRFGFSSLNNLLAVLPCTVRFGDDTEMALGAFLSTPRQKKLLTHVCIKKDGTSVQMHSFRNTATDLPILAVAVGKRAHDYTVYVGARPMGPVCCVAAQTALTQGDITTAKAAVQGLCYGTNTRGSADYRRRLSGVLLERCVKGLGK